ncbi:MAG: 2-dehydro-3-deoxy-D-gluconate 5-dehydrogenase KduD [Spirochaetaceae bacterium]|nr:2-dehydro-3-deoxy-D-gluconate 5-dehydrogenase KduD [Spirochaetaceae bacterium]
MKLFDLTGKVAIVTGSNQGLGQGYAIALAEAGADIVGVSIAPSTETAAEVAKFGRKFLDLSVNLMDMSKLEGVITEAVKAFGKVDILVNNAGMIRRADLVDFSEKDWDDVMDLNLKSVFLLSQAFVRQLLKQGTGGKIVNIASMLSFQGGIRVPSYAASKGGIASLTKAFANELANKGITCNAIAPGYFATENTAPLRADAARDKAILERIPAGRWGTASDLMGGVIFLSSSASDYVNGHILAIDGGWLAR